MARTEARIFTTIWNDPDFIALPRSAQGTFFFLLSQKDLNHCGVLPVRPTRWRGKAAGLTIDDLRADLEALTAAEFIVVDEDAGELLIRSLIRRDKVLRQPFLMPPLIGAIDEVESPRIRRVLLGELVRIQAEGDVNEKLVDSLARLIETLRAEVEATPDTDPDTLPDSHPERVSDTHSDTHTDTHSDRDSDTHPDTQRGIGGRYVSGERSPVPRTPDPVPLAANARARAREAAAATGATLIGNALLDEHLAAFKRRPPRDVIRAVGEEIDKLLDQGFETDVIRRALSELRADATARSPRVLPHIVNRLINGPANRASPTSIAQPSRNAQITAAAMERAKAAEAAQAAAEQRKELAG